MQQRDARMAWWREAKFGMFIHWGVYAVPAGEHKGVRDGEWIMRRAEIPVKEYRDYAKQFTAEHYDPKAWVDLAQKAGNAKRSLQEGQIRLVRGVFRAK